MNSRSYLTTEKQSFVFDILNGAVGFMNGCYVAMQYLAFEDTTVLVCASEVENNKSSEDYACIGLEETGSAFLLSSCDDKTKGFGGMAFYSYPEEIDTLKSAWKWHRGVHFMDYQAADSLHEAFIRSIDNSLAQFLVQEAISLDEIQWVLPPLISVAFSEQLRKQLKTDPERYIDLDSSNTNYYSSSIPYAFDYLQQQRQVKEGDIALMISVGSGVQVGLALYYF